MARSLKANRNLPHKNIYSIFYWIVILILLISSASFSSVNTEEFVSTPDFELFGATSGETQSRAPAPGIDIGPNQTSYGKFGQTVTYLINVVNNQTVSDYIDITAKSDPANWAVTLFHNDGLTVLRDSAIDGDGVPDTGLLTPSAMFKLIVKVKIPQSKAFNMPEITIITGSSSLSPVPNVGECKLVTKSFPHLDATKSASSQQIYEESAEQYALDPTRTRVTLNIKGGGVPTTVERFHDVVFLIDNTGSMVANDPNKVRLAAANSYVDNMSLPDTGAVVTFFGNFANPRGYAWLARGPSFPQEHMSADYTRLKNNINWTGNIVNGGTNILRAMQVGVSELMAYGNLEHVWYMILLTDGYDSGNFWQGDRDPAILGEAQNAANNNIVIFTIGLGSTTNVQLLQNVANITKGEYFSAQNASQLMDIYNEIQLTVSKVAGRDPNPADNNHMVREVLPPYIHLVPDSFRLEPGSVVFDPFPVNIDQNPVNTTLYWDIDRILVNQSWLVSFEIMSSKTGWVPVGVYPDARVMYTNGTSDTEYEIAFPEVWIEVLPIPRPDLIPIEVKINGVPYDPDDILQVQRGDPVSISSKIINSGEMATHQFASEFHIGYFNASQPGTPFYSNSVSSLAVDGVSGEFSSVWIAPFTLSDFIISVVADWKDDIFEGASGEMNNVFNLTIRVVHNPVIDLLPKAIKVDGKNLSEYQSKLIELEINAESKIELRVANIGNENTNYFASKFFVSLYDSAQPGIPLGTLEINLITPGSSSRVLVFLWQAPAVVGIFDLEIIIDSTDAITEGITGELNNKVTFTFSVQKDVYIDLVPYSLSIEQDVKLGPDDYDPVGPSNVSYDMVIGQSVQISFRIYSHSNEPSNYFGSSFDTILFNGSGAIQKYFDRIVIDNIEPQTATGTYSTAWRAPLAAGNYSVGISIDDNNDIFEESGGEDNNIMTIAFNVFDLVAPPEVSLVKDPVTSDVHLQWDTVAGAGSYQVFGGENPQTIDLKTPLGETDKDSWRDIYALDRHGSYFYTIRAVDERGWSGPTGGIVGYYTLEFKSGYNSFSIPLKPFSIASADWYADEFFELDFETIYNYDNDIDQWIGHPKFLPIGMDDFHLVLGESYMLYTSLDFKYTFIGRPEDTLRFVENVAGESWFAGDPNDRSFRDSLSIERRESGFMLQWAELEFQLGSGTHLQHYEVYRLSARGALNLPSSGPLDDLDDGLERITTTRLSRFIDTAAPGLLELGLPGTEEREFHYIVVPVDEFGRRGGSTYSASIARTDLEPGYNSFGHSLLGAVQTPVHEFISAPAHADSDTVYYYDRDHQSWIGHPAFLPSFRDNPEMAVGEGYLVFILSDTGKQLYFTT